MVDLITTDLDPTPSRQRPTVFASDGNTLIGKLPAWTTEANALATEANSNALAAAASATAAETAESNAETAQAAAELARDMANATTNFAGSWADLAGALSVPSSVLHGGVYWALLSDLADVTTSEPDTANTDWAVIFDTNRYQPKYNYIGVAGTQGFGVGILPAAWLPDNVYLMPGTETPGHDNYGNYQLADGSVVCWVPAFFYKVGTGANGLTVNTIDIKPLEEFTDEADANTDGYALHRAFKDGGETYAGFFVFKYKASKVAWGSGYISASIKDGLPISTNSAHNPIADLTNCATNAYFEVIDAAKAIGGVDGAAAADPQWFATSRFQKGALALLALAHGQAATSTAYCAWYNATYNYPKGCNDNALGDVDDATVSYVSDGYSNCGKTGSGTPFAKTTHNGQACGVADLNGLMWEIDIGVTCVASAVTITAATQANPVQITAASHGRSTGDPVMIASVGGMVELNDKIYTVTVVDADNFTLDGVDGTALTAYTSGGTATVGDFYVADEATAMKDFTSGNSGATDHWGATGVAAMMTSFIPGVVDAYPNNGFAQRMGSGANQVLDEATSGNGYVLAGLGIPKDTDGADTTGTNLFGKDYFYQYIRNELCVLSAGTWSASSNAGVWSSAWYDYRTNSYYYVGFRCACYPVLAAIAA